MESILVPIFVCVVLPVAIVGIYYWSQINAENKRGRRLTVGYDDAKELPASEGADTGFAYQELYEALNRLPAKERTSVLLFYMEGYSVKEIADIQEVSQDAVKQHLSRGRNHLRGLLSNE